MQKVQLKCWYPRPTNIKFSEDFTFTIPSIRKMTLTEESEKAIFGDISPYSTSPLPPLPWGNERYYEKKLALIDQCQVDIYNAKMELSYKDKPEILEKQKIKTGIVEVFRAGYCVSLENVENILAGHFQD